MIVFSWRLSALVIYSVAGRQPGSNSIWQYSVKRVGDNAFLKIPKFFKKCSMCFLGAIQRFSQILAYQHKGSKAIWYSFVWTDKTFAIQKVNEMDGLETWHRSVCIWLTVCSDQFSPDFKSKRSLRHGSF